MRQLDNDEELEGLHDILTTRMVQPIRVNVNKTVVNQQGSIQYLVDDTGVKWNWANVLTLTPVSED